MPDPSQREVVDEELRAVLEEQRDAMAVPVARGPIPLAKIQHARFDLAVAELETVGVIAARGGRRDTQEDVRRGRRGRIAKCLEYGGGHWRILSRRSNPDGVGEITRPGKNFSARTRGIACNPNRAQG
jgi:hypothetical protein